MNAWRRLTVRATLPLRRHFLRRRVGRLVCEEVEGIPLIVLPTVFNAAVFGSSDVLVRALRTHAGACGAVRGRLLDMGTGTGIGAIAAAQLGYEVVAVDLNPDAVRCARINALQHRLEKRFAVEDRVAHFRVREEFRERRGVVPPGPERTGDKFEIRSREAFPTIWSYHRR